MRGSIIFPENTLTKPHFPRDKWRGNFQRWFVIPSQKEIFSKICKKSTRFVGSISERTFTAPINPGRSQTEIKNFPSSFWLKIPRRNGRALNHLHVPWQLHTHSSDTFSPTRAGSPVRHDHFMRATTMGLKCRLSTGKATTAGQDNDTSRKSWAEAQGWNSHGPDSLSGIRWIQSARGRGQIGARKI